MTYSCKFQFAMIIVGGCC